VPRRGGRWIRDGLPGLAVVGILSGTVALLIHRDWVESEERRRAEAARLASRGAVFARGQIGEVLELCREGWTGELSLPHEPVALAWTRKAVDAYFYQGADEGSLRQVRCDPRGVVRGPRVVHPLYERMPAEAPSEAEVKVEREWPRAQAVAASSALDEGDLALELLQHPTTGVVLARRWRSGDGGAMPTLDPPDAPSFAFLLASAGFRAAPGVQVTALRPLPRQRWVADAEAAFALLERELPGAARVSELTLEEDGVDVTIDWPTPAFDGHPPVPYGDRTFDEYGIADMGYWYPRESPGFGCARGETLARVRASFREAKARMGEQALASAWYSCSPAYSNRHDAVWHLRPK
jgi:hypothetical protein